MLQLCAPLLQCIVQRIPLALAGRREGGGEKRLFAESVISRSAAARNRCLYIYVRMHNYVHEQWYACTYVRMYMYVYVCIYTCTSTHTHTCTYIYTECSCTLVLHFCVFTDAYTCIYTEGSSYMCILHVYKYIHTCIFMYACICIYIYLYIYTYMNTQWSPLGICHRLVCYVLVLNICSCVCLCMCVWYSALAYVCVCDIQHRRMCAAVLCVFVCVRVCVAKDSCVA